jgi:hypothetical protein
MESKNESEKVFEQYLDSNGFQDKWRYEPSIQGKSKKPDYLLDWKGQECFFEVKELRKKTNQPIGEAVWIDPYSSLRSEIDEAREKFREYKKYSCSLVVFNVDDRQARLKPIFVFGAMLGDLGFTWNYDADKGASATGSETNAFLRGGKMIDDKKGRLQNTTISAIIALEEFSDDSEIQKALKEELKKYSKPLTLEEEVAINMKLAKDHHSSCVPRVVVIENPFARMVFPADLFNGPFDERWRWNEKQNGKIERVFAGSKLEELEQLRGRS